MPTCLSACLLTPPPLAPVRTIAWSRPLVWLSRALQDISNAPLISLAHGLALILIGAAILTLGHNRFWLMAGALSGFLVVGRAPAWPVWTPSSAWPSRSLGPGDALPSRCLACLLRARGRFGGPPPEHPAWPAPAAVAPHSPHRGHVRCRQYATARHPDAVQALLASSGAICATTSAVAAVG